MARTGKIARLPRSLRTEVNRRLDNGQRGADIVQWLNDLEEVQRALSFAHGGKPVTEQNLSEWRQGGFLEWKQHQPACEWVGQLAGQADQITDEAGLMPLSDSVASIAAMALGKRLQELSATSLAEEGRLDEFVLLLKQLTILRKDDQKAAQLRMDLESYERTWRGVAC
jgi:hypothetical protein